MDNPKHIILSVTNDIFGDQRVRRIASSLKNAGFRVTIVGRQKKDSPEISLSSIKIVRFKLLFHRKMWFYMAYNWRLFWYLLFCEFDAVVANDTDTLPAAWLAAKIKTKKLVYDSHEYFTQVPELLHRPLIQRIWYGIENICVPDTDLRYTVSEKIAEEYSVRFLSEFQVLHNYPGQNEIAFPFDFQVDDKKKHIIYQGALNKGRGLELLISSMPYLSNFVLIIVGSGDIAHELKKQAAEQNHTHNIRFLGRIPPEQLRWLTPQMHLGVSLEEDLGLNYRYALPNKLFDYIHAQIPVLVSNLPAMANIVRNYNIGEILYERKPQTLAQTIEKMLINSESRKPCFIGLKKASTELIWEKEEKNLHRWYRSLFLW